MGTVIYKPVSWEGGEHWRPADKTARGKKDSISYTLYQDAVSIWIAVVFSLVSNNSVSWLYYVFLAKALKLFYNTLGKKKPSKKLIIETTCQAGKCCQRKFSFPFLLFFWQAGQGLFSLVMWNLIIYVHKKIDGTNHLSRMTHHCLSKCHKRWQANYNHETH